MDILTLCIALFVICFFLFVLFTLNKKETKKTKEQNVQISKEQLDQIGYQVAEKLINHLFGKNSSR